MMPGQTSVSPVELDPRADAASAPFVQRWNSLVSTTNWEKGRIIYEWREARIEAGEAPQEYSDEAWSRQVGGVTPQHIGRLRRVHERFGQTQQDYEGLYWSHFQAALDWDDAEMWLEGAVQNGWTVAAMREKRWETLGAPAESKPREEDIVVADLDEDAPETDSSAGSDAADASSGRGDAKRRVKSSDSGEEDEDAEPDDDPIVADESSVAPVRPFENLPALPADVSEAFELFKLAILRHKLSGWSEVGEDDLLASLEALKRLVVAPPE